MAPPAPPWLPSSKPYANTNSFLCPPPPPGSSALIGNEVARLAGES